MKRRKELFLITLIALFVLSSVISYNLNSDLKKTDKNIQTDEINEIDEFRTPKKSWFNNSMDPIFIDNEADHNWTWARKQDWCRLGNGSLGNPYVIENLTIDASGLSHGIIIRNSKNVYFKINNCTIYNAESMNPKAGIVLRKTNNGTIINNDCSQNVNGIVLDRSNNNNISGNTVNNNGLGIFLAASNNNTISGNTVNNNWLGIFLAYSKNNTISGNTVNNNDYGINIGWNSDNNTVSGNTANNNDYGIYLYRSNNNTVSRNTLIGNVFFIEDYESIENNIKDDNTCYTTILPPGINDFEIEPYCIDNVDVGITIALNDETEVLFSAFINNIETIDIDNETEVLFSTFNDNNIEEAPLDNGLIFMNLQLNDTNNLNQIIDAPITFTLNFDISKYKPLEVFWFNEDANGEQGAWEEIPFIDLGNGKIVISVKHTSIFAITGEIIFPISSSDGGAGGDDFKISLFLILLVFICSLTIVTASSTYYYKTRSQTRDKTRDRTLRERFLTLSIKNKAISTNVNPCVIKEAEKNNRALNFRDNFDNSEFIRLLKEEIDLEKVELFNISNMTAISNEFWEKLDKLELDEQDFNYFVIELLSLPPEERQEILDGMLKHRTLRERFLTRFIKTKAKSTNVKPSVIKEAEKNNRALNYIENIDNSKYIQLLKEEIDLEKVELLNISNMTAISNEFWEKLDELELDEKDYNDFVNELLSLPPEERQEILDGMLVLKHNDGV